MSDPTKPDVTAPVTEPETPKKPPKEKTAWERVNMTKADWDALEIPPMFRRAPAVSDTKPPARPPSPASSPTPSSVAAPAASSSRGKKSGKRRSSGTASTPISTTDQPTKAGTEASSTEPPRESDVSLTDFDKFKIVTPADIEKKIRHEADRRYRDWTPSAADTRKRKGKTSRPRIEWFIKQVRKEFY